MKEMAEDRQPLTTLSNNLQNKILSRPVIYMKGQVHSFSEPPEYNKIRKVSVIKANYKFHNQIES